MSAHNKCFHGEILSTLWLGNTISGAMCLVTFHKPVINYVVTISLSQKDLKVYGILKHRYEVCCEKTV